MLHRFLSTVIATAGLVSVAGAQQPAPQATVPFETIGYGETVSNFLTTADASFADSTLFKAFVFTAAAGDTVTIHLSSPDFDAQLIVADSAENIVADDNNSGGSCNAYITTVLPAPGRYVIYANARGIGELGQFQLTLQQGKQPPEASTACRGFLDYEGQVWVGGAVEGTMGANSSTLRREYYAVWLLPETGGQPFTVDLISQDIDPALILVRGFSEIVGSNDDGAGGCNARVSHTPTNTRPYRVIAVSRGERKPGSYVLRVTAGAQPQLTQPPCDRG